MGFRRNTRYCERCKEPAEELQFAQPHRKFCSKCVKEKKHERDNLRSKIKRDEKNAN